jgi:hypothetical protein
MNLTDDLLRETLRVTGDEFPDRLRPLALPAIDEHAGRRSALGRLRGTRWLPAMAVAAAVLTVAVAATTIATGSGHRRAGGTPGPANSGTQAHGSALPPYYVVVISAATIRDSRTGAVLATVKSPRGYWFIDAAAGPDSDSFLLEANQHSRHPGLYLLRFTPRGRRIRLTRLPIPLPPYVRGLAMSPGGTEVAVASGTDSGKVPSTLMIYTLSGKPVRHWQDPGTICLSGGGGGLPCLSWGAGSLAFTWSYPAIRGNRNPGLAAEGVRLIPATAASGSLVASSRLLLPFATINAASSVLSGDGKTIAADVQLRPAKGKIYNSYEEFSTATGKLTGRYWESPTIDVGSVLWTNWTGSRLIVTAPYPRTSQSLQWPLGILSGGRFTPLPTPPTTWFAIAF